MWAALGRQDWPRMADWLEERSLGPLHARYELDLVKVLGFTPAEARAIGINKLRERYFHEMIELGDAEAIAVHKKKTTLQNQREGEAQFTARLQPKVYINWCVSYTDLDMIDPDTKQQGYNISIIENPVGFLVANKLVYGRPTLEDIFTILHVGIAFPLEGKGRRPSEILVPWRMRDMWPRLEKWMWEMEIEPLLETREQAMSSCAKHGTDIEGRNNPDPEDWDREPGEILKEEGNDLFCLKRYAKAIEKYTEALRHEPDSAVLYSNRAIAYLRMGSHAKALADVDKAIKLKPKYIIALARKGEILVKLSRIQDARNHYTHCIASLKQNFQFRSALKALDA
ncbi:probable small glutamine-rich tetratricopeptide repeat-containing protein at C-terminar half [Coccomyxa sp. Obi]|nr:probable small glutamine-rich tetratricopeptide repeat-containing protein at C-terminar half [Coccomyxa sp. Obi]